MKKAKIGDSGTMLMGVGMLLAGVVFARPLNAQNPDLQQRVEEVKQAAAKNKVELMQYTWNELVTISLKGEQKKQQHYQVRLGPDGQPQKTSLDPPPEPPSGSIPFIETPTALK